MVGEGTLHRATLATLVVMTADMVVMAVMDEGIETCAGCQGFQLRS